MQLSEALIDEALDIGLLGGDREVDVPRIPHQHCGLAGALIEDLAMQRVTGHGQVRRDRRLSGPCCSGSLSPRQWSESHSRKQSR